MNSEDDHHVITLPESALHGAIHIGSAELGQGETVTMTNQEPTTLQYATQGPNGEIFIPVNLPGGGQAYQIMSSANVIQAKQEPSNQRQMTIAGLPDEEASKKRELRLLKNSDAARECRRKKKEYVKCLENRVAVLENQNKALIEELKSLKELYCQKDG